MTLKSNAEELALLSQEIGAEVIGGLVRYLGELGDIEIGAVGIGRYLYQPKDQELMLVVAHVDPEEEPPLISGLSRAA